MGTFNIASKETRVRVVLDRVSSLFIRRRILFYILAILALYLLSRLLFLTRLPIFFDEAIYIRWSQQGLKGGQFLISLLDGKPPLHIWALMPFLAIIKDPLLAGRLLSVVAGMFSTVAVIMIGKELVGWRLGLISGLFYVLCPFALWYDRLALAEALMLALWLFTIYFSLLAARTLRSWWILPIGTTLGLAMMTKGTAELLFLIIPFVFIARPELRNQSVRRPLLHWIIIVVLSLAFGFAIFNLLKLSSHYGFVTERTATLTKTLSEVAKRPFDVFFSNLKTIFTTLVIYLTPTLFIVAVLGPFVLLARRRRTSAFVWIWIVVVVLVEALLAKHWPLDTIQARYFLTVVPPLLICAAFSTIECLKYFKNSNLAPRGKKFLPAALLMVLLALPSFSIVTAVSEPASALLPYWERFQYVSDWPSGWGIKEIADKLDWESKSGKVVVGSNFTGVDAGLPTYALEDYLLDNKNVTFVPFYYYQKRPPEALVQSTARGLKTYCVFNVFPFPEATRVPPQGWPLTLISRYYKDGNRTTSMCLFRFD